MTFWASGVTDKTPNDNTRLWSNFQHCPLPPLLPPSLLRSVPIQPSASENDRLSGGPPLCCRWRSFVWSLICYVCVRAHAKASATTVRAWPGLVLVLQWLSNHSKDQRPRTWIIWKWSRGRRAASESERSKAIINTKSRYHYKWLFRVGCGRSVCVCGCVCVYVSSADPLSLSEALSVCNWILSLFHCSCLCLWRLDGQIFFFFSKMSCVRASVPLCGKVKWPEKCWHLKAIYRFWSFS